MATAAIPALIGLALAGPARSLVYLASSAPGIDTYDLSGGDYQQLLSAAGLPSAIAVNGTYIFWIDPALGTIERANLDGTDATGTGGRPSLIPNAFPQDTPNSLAVDSRYVYWIRGQWIARANLDGSGVQTDFITPPDIPATLAVDAGHIYWGDAYQGIFRANLDGTDPAPFIASALTNSLVVGDGYIYWVDAAGYLMAQSEGIGRANIDGSDANNAFLTDVYAGGAGAGSELTDSLAVNGSHIYWGADSTVDFTDVNDIGEAGLAGDAVNPSFVGASAGALAADDRTSAPSSTGLSCAPSSLVITIVNRRSSPTTPIRCTAIVSAVPPSSTTPGGTVALTSSKAGTFSQQAAGGPGCALLAAAPGSATCALDYVPATADTGVAQLSAQYSGSPLQMPGGPAHAAVTITRVVRATPTISYAYYSGLTTRRHKLTLLAFAGPSYHGQPAPRLRSVTIVTGLGTRFASRTRLLRGLVVRGFNPVRRVRFTARVHQRTLRITVASPVPDIAVTINGRALTISRALVRAIRRGRQPHISVELHVADTAGDVARRHYRQVAS